MATSQPYVGKNINLKALLIDVLVWGPLEPDPFIFSDFSR